MKTDLLLFCYVAHTHQSNIFWIKFFALSLPHVCPFYDKQNFCFSFHLFIYLQFDNIRCKKLAL